MDKKRGLAESLKKARIKQNKSLLRLSQDLGIPKETIISIEEWEKSELPEEPYLSKILERYAVNVGLTENNRVSSDQMVLPASNLFNKTIFISEYTKRIIFSSFFIILAGYLVFTGFDLIANPKLVVIQPTQFEYTNNSKVIVKGLASQQNLININGEPVLVGEDGSFLKKVYVREGQNYIEISSANSIGRQTNRTLEVYRR